MFFKKNKVASKKVPNSAESKNRLNLRFAHKIFQTMPEELSPYELRQLKKHEKILAKKNKRAKEYVEPENVVIRNNELTVLAKSDNKTVEEMFTTFNKSDNKIMEQKRKEKENLAKTKNIYSIKW